MAYKNQEFANTFAQGLRTALLDCHANHSDLLSRSSIFWVSTFATNQSHIEADEMHGWRSLWNDRLKRWEDTIQEAVLDLVDGIVPGHFITQSYRGHNQADHTHQTEAMTVHLVEAMFNYAAWGRARWRGHKLAPTDTDPARDEP